MKGIYAIAGAVLLAIALLSVAFTYQEAAGQRLSQTANLQYRTQVLADSLDESIAPAFAGRATSTVQRIVDRIAAGQRVVGVGVFDSTGYPVAQSPGLAPYSASPGLVSQVLDSDQPQGVFAPSQGVDRYVFVEPMHGESGAVIGALVIVQNAQYIDDAVGEIWRNNLLRLAIQICIVALALFVLVRFVFFRAIARFADSLRSARRGQAAQDPGDEVLFRPLSGEIAKFTSSLRQARRAASEEARLRLEKLETPWTAERLKEFIKAYVKDRPIYVVSNREPFIHSRGKKGELTWAMPASGLVTALTPVMEAAGGMWLAHGAGPADKEAADAEGKLTVPPDDPRFTLKRVFLSEKEVRGHYVGFSNEALWPLCHQAHTRPIFREEDWKEYRRVNGAFAAALLAEIKQTERPLVLVQDYHFALLPAMLKASRPETAVALFWHIPWPSPEAFSICPYRAQILEGMLGADLIGFHTQQYCNNFLDTVGSEIEALIDLENFTVTREGHASLVEPFPISIAFSGEGEEEEPGRGALERLGIRAPKVILGVDRLDYTKGILERLKGLEFLLDGHPELTRQVVLLQIAEPSREQVEKYRQYAGEVAAEAQRVNEKFGTDEWRPVVLETRHYTHETLAKLYRLAAVCLVTSLHDGMNLVAKEFVAARGDEAGVLVLSKFTGASRDLRQALVVNPYSAEEVAAALYRGLSMPPSEQHRRMKAMRAAVRDYNVYRWSAEFIKALTRLE